MQVVLAWGIRVVLWLQRASPALDLPMLIITQFGDVFFIFALICVLYWNIDHANGARLAVLFIASTYINIIAKVLLGQPRPYMVDPRVLMLDNAAGGGLPSGHTQAVTVVWLYLATRYHRRWLWAVCAAFVTLVPLSRVYLGVHYPSDVLGGFLLGLALLALWQLEVPVERWLTRHRMLWSFLLILALPVLAALSAPFGDEAFLLLGAGTGFCLGLTFERRWLRFRRASSLLQHTLRLGVGAAPALLLYLINRMMLIPAFGLPALRFASFTLLGLWISLGAPWLFGKLGLAPRVGAAA